MNAIPFNLQRLTSAAAVIEHPTGARYGCEASIVIRDDLDERVDDYILFPDAARRGRLQRILDLGGATGHRVSQFNAEAFIVDICDHRAAITQRNLFRGQKTIIGFAQGDVANLQNIELPKAEWDLIHWRRTAHWMSLPEVENLVSYMPRLAGPQTHLAMCFMYSQAPVRGTIQYPKTRHNNFYQHHPKDILKLLRVNGYKILSHGNDAWRNGRTYKIFAKVPSPALQ